MNMRPILSVLIILGLAWGCASYDPLVRDAKNNFDEGNYQDAIAAANEALETNPGDPFAHYYHAMANAGLAQETEPPSDRKGLYEEVYTSMNNAKRLFEETQTLSSEAILLDDVYSNLWAFEHNSGANYILDDSLREVTPNPEELAIQHFENAIIIQPDSSISHVVLASTRFNTGDIDGAIVAYERAMTVLDPPTVDDYDFLTNLHLMREDYQNALDLAEEAHEQYPDEASFVQYMADSHLYLGDLEQAMALIRGLIEDDPENPQYYYVLGTQIYQVAQEHLDEATNKYTQAWDMELQLPQLTQAERADLQEQIDQLKSEAAAAEEEGNELGDMAAAEIQKSIELNPENDEAYNVLGIIYQNRASLLFDKRNEEARDDNELAMEFDQEARSYLDRALENYEQAAELNPDEVSYWERLFRVYTTLGMSDEADEAMERAGMD
ncbi:MAG: tetratricopeptide repeat protein [Balneolaceae bacterium]